MADPKQQDNVLQQILASQEEFRKSQDQILASQDEFRKSQSDLSKAVTDLQKGQKAMGMQMVDMQQQIGNLRDGQDRLDLRMDGMGGRMDRIEDKMDAGFDDTRRLIADIPGAVIDGVELHIDRKIQQHEKRFHSRAVAA